MDLYLRKQRFNALSIAIIIGLLLICIMAPLVEPRGVSALASLQASTTDQPASDYDDSPNIITDGAVAITHGAGQVMNTAGVKLLGAGVSLTKGVTYFDKGIGSGAAATAGFVANGAAKAVALPAKAASVAVYPFKHAANLTHFSSIIRPEDHTPVPTITQLRSQQASIIQQGTMNLVVATATTGSGGACDAGAGNGGYPMQWCNAPMNTISTVAYSSEAINRECTSYAYWYFTSIEGHTDLHVTGDAKYWAGTSNYPTHVSPAVGAIAVETAGAYGHVAIVQALPGQLYEGKVIPAGYIVVSEMNYDWSGHFRYSYSPMDKFSRYIYK